jgi:hypothetical protein
MRRGACSLGLLALWAAGLCLPATAALACSVCTDPDDPRAKAYFDMTIFMSLFPLLAMGIVGIWLWRRVVAAEAASAR